MTLNDVAVSFVQAINEDEDIKEILQAVANADGSISLVPEVLVSPSLPLLVRKMVRGTRQTITMQRILTYLIHGTIPSHIPTIPVLPYLAYKLRA